MWNNGCGFTNQIFSLITGIIIAHKEHYKIIIIDTFLNDFSDQTSINVSKISDVINIVKLNSFLIENYQISIFDKYSCGDLSILENGNHTFGWITDNNKEMFEHILTNIEYHQTFIDYSLNETNGINDKFLNIVHLRIEDDAITHWSKMNNMTSGEFKLTLETLYIILIKKHINKNDLTVILTHSSDNNVIQFLKENGYNYKTTQKHFEGREQNAIVDLLVGKRCNNVFIGNFNFEKNSGSTFSYYISKLIDSSENINIKNIHIDLDNIIDTFTFNSI